MQKRGKTELNLIKGLKSIADIGLVYAEDDYNRERYGEVRKISIFLLSIISNTPLKTLNNFFLPEKNYPTVKVDVRAFILNDTDEILIVKKSIDNKWTIPGGWADIGDTPSQPF